MNRKKSRVNVSNKNWPLYQYSARICDIVFSGTHATKILAFSPPTKFSGIREKEDFAVIGTLEATQENTAKKKKVMTRHLSALSFLPLLLLTHTPEGRRLPAPAPAPAAAAAASRSRRSASDRRPWRRWKGTR
jgi:hypothetical protein